MSPSLKLPTLQHSLGKRYPIAYYVNYDHLSMRHQNFLTTITTNQEPVSYSEATKNKRWCYVMSSKIHALEKNSTWVINDLSKGKRHSGASGCTK